MLAFREGSKTKSYHRNLISITRDGKVVVFHDESLKPDPAMPKGQLRDSTFDTLQHLHLSGTSEHMPLFQMSFAMSMGGFLF